MHQTIVYNNHTDSLQYIKNKSLNNLRVKHYPIFDNLFYAKDVTYFSEIDYEKRHLEALLKRDLLPYYKRLTKTEK